MSILTSQLVNTVWFYSCMSWMFAYVSYEYVCCTEKWVCKVDVKLIIIRFQKIFRTVIEGLFLEFEADFWNWKQNEMKSDINTNYISHSITRITNYWTNRRPVFWVFSPPISCIFHADPNIETHFSLKY